jgi:hypothetical protein
MVETTSRLNMTRVKAIATEIVDLVAGCRPPEFQAALTLATAIYFKAQFPKDLEEAYKLHVENMRAAMEELDRTPVLDLTGRDVTELLG